MKHPPLEKWELYSHKGLPEQHTYRWIGSNLVWLRVAYPASENTWFVLDSPLDKAYTLQEATDKLLELFKYYGLPRKG